MAKDDALAFPRPVHRTYPSAVNARMGRTLAPFVRKSLAVNETLLAVLNDKLALPKGALARRHTRDEHSGSEARCIRRPAYGDGSVDEAQAAIGAHSDFGSLVFVHVSRVVELRLTNVPPSLSSIIAWADCKSWSPERIRGNTSSPSPGMRSATRAMPWPSSAAGFCGQTCTVLCQ